ncbi:MAG: chalcone isomerase family protein [Betaproteobacteria bacterium]
MPRLALGAAPPLPAAVIDLAPGMRTQGGGEMRFLGFTVYDAWYWAPSRAYSLAQPFVLDLHYHRSLDGARIAERSADEIAKLGEGTVEQRSRWDSAMRAIFPSVRRGDRLTGVNLPAQGVRFFHNGNAIGEIADPSFARAFFGIWLDPRTSHPHFRERLLGRPDAGS